MAWQRALGSWEAAFALNDLTLLCGTKEECSGRARKEVRVRGRWNGRMDGDGENLE